MRFSLSSLGLIVVMATVRGEEYNDNALVTCSACNGVKVRDWNCEVNCKVTKTGNVTVVAADLEVRMSRLENELKTNLTALQEQVRALELENRELKAEVTQRDLVLNSTKDALFLATISADLTTSNGDVIEWDDVRIDVGSNYNMASHAYVTPSNGYYRISVHVRKNGSMSQFKILVDGAARVDAGQGFSGTVAPHGAATVILQLTAGQSISVQNIGSWKIFSTGPITSWFMVELV